MSHKIGQLWGIMLVSLYLRLKRNIQRRAFRVALVRAYTRWAPHHWEWVDYFFNEHFLTYRAGPYLIDCLADNTRPDPVELAALWAEQVRWCDEELRQRRIDRLVPVAVHFLACLETELGACPEFQPNSMAMLQRQAVQ
jgi:hypothetical protein